ncbi:MAG TPA: hypothetical protein VGH28_07320 [Polyangiaceae bacterium]
MPIEDRSGAERLAKAILADMTLDHAERVRASRDLLGDLAREIEDGRALFRSRVAQPLHGVYEDELLPWQGEAKDQALKVGGAPIDRTRLLIAIGVGVAFAAVVVWLSIR